jgi:chromosome segregation ATPase
LSSDETIHYRNTDEKDIAERIESLENQLKSRTQWLGAIVLTSLLGLAVLFVNYAAEVGDIRRVLSTTREEFVTLVKPQTKKITVLEQSSASLLWAIGDVRQRIGEVRQDLSRTKTEYASLSSAIGDVRQNIGEVREGLQGTKAEYTAKSKISEATIRAIEDRLSTLNSALENRATVLERLELITKELRNEYMETERISTASKSDLESLKQLLSPISKIIRDENGVVMIE